MIHPPPRFSLHQRGIIRLSESNLKKNLPKISDLLIPDSSRRIFEHFDSHAIHKFETGSSKPAHDRFPSPRIGHPPEDSESFHFVEETARLAERVNAFGGIKKLKGSRRVKRDSEEAADQFELVGVGVSAPVIFGALSACRAGGKETETVDE